VSRERYEPYFLGKGTLKRIVVRGMGPEKPILEVRDCQQETRSSSASISCEHPILTNKKRGILMVRIERSAL
jgi:hypothetical protein